MHVRMGEAIAQSWDLIICKIQMMDVSHMPS